MIAVCNEQKKNLEDLNIAESHTQMVEDLSVRRFLASAYIVLYISLIDVYVLEIGSPIS